jgi:hypothetical protein
MNNKRKGSNFEREVGKILTTAYYPEGDGMFQRIYSHPIPAKGEVMGDLKAMKYMLTDPETGDKSLVLDNSWPFNVECKNYIDIKPFYSGLYGKETELFEWLEQAREVSKKENKKPLVVFKLFRSYTICVMDSLDFEELLVAFGSCPKKTYRLSSQDRDKKRTIYLILLSDLLEWIDIGYYKNRRYIRSLVQKMAREA